MTYHGDRPPRQLYVAAEHVAALPCVTTTEVCHSDAVGRPVVFVTLGPDTDRVPPRVLRRLINHDLGVEDVSRQGPHRVVRAF